MDAKHRMEVPESGTLWLHITPKYNAAINRRILEEDKEENRMKREEKKNKRE